MMVNMKKREASDPVFNSAACNELISTEMDKSLWSKVRQRKGIIQAVATKAGAFHC